ncbi:hypothetical protein U1Q18_035586 [Sarracenia purpurea var. burkii]
MVEESRSLEYTPTWIVAIVCFVIVLLSLLAERGLHRIGKCLKRKGQDALFEALQKLKEAFQGLLSHMCIPSHLASYMLPCKLETSASSGSENNHGQYFKQTMTNGRRLFATDTGSNYCARKGMVPLLSLEALHQLHIFIFVLAVVHVIFCATTMVLGGARVSFFKQFYGSITKSDYIALRSGFVRAHCPSVPDFDFHEYMMRTLEVDFKRIVGIRAIVQFLCSYSILPLYALVTQMGSMFKQGMFDENVQKIVERWVEGRRRRGPVIPSAGIHRMTKESSLQDDHISEETTAVGEGILTSTIELN